MNDHRGVPDHRSRLRAELLAAAQRHYDPAPTRGQVATRAPATSTPAAPTPVPARRARVLVLAAAAVVAVVVFSGASSVVAPRPVAADVFEVSSSPRTVEVAVIGEVDDPRAAAAELEALGLEVTMTPQPTSPSLVGAILAVSSSATGVDVAAPSGTRVESWRIPRGHSAPLDIAYGRSAGPDEVYAASEPPPGCAELAGRVLDDDLVDRLEDDHGPELRWVLIEGAEVAGPDELVGQARIVSVLPLSKGASLVSVTRGEVPDGMACAT